MADYDPKELAKLIEEADPAKIKAYMKEYDLVLEGSKIRPKQEKRTEYLKANAFWDMRQHSKKILLNS